MIPETLSSSIFLLTINFQNNILSFASLNSWICHSVLVFSQKIPSGSPGLSRWDNLFVISVFPVLFHNTFSSLGGFCNSLKQRGNWESASDWVLNNRVGVFSHSCVTVPFLGLQSETQIVDGKPGVEDTDMCIDASFSSVYIGSSSRKHLAHLANEMQITIPSVRTARFLAPFVFFPPIQVPKRW